MSVKRCKFNLAKKYWYSRRCSHVAQDTQVRTKEAGRRTRSLSSRSKTVEGDEHRAQNPWTTKCVNNHREKKCTSIPT